LEVDRRAIRKRIGHLKRELDRIERQRSVRRKRRHDFKKVALVGYTNVGKSSLLNVLSNAEVFVENRLFATLDATIREFPLESHRKVLLIDTVGFIRKLPHHLVASFHSTLEETIEANLLLHVIDVSHPQFEEQLGSVLGVLLELEIHQKPIIHVFNKVDLLSDRSILPSLAQRFPQAVFTSAMKGMGLESLRQEIVTVLKEGEVEEVVCVPIEETKKIAQIHSIAIVTEKIYEDGMARLRIRATPEGLSRVHALLESVAYDKDSHR